MNKKGLIGDLIIGIIILTLIGIVVYFNFIWIHQYLILKSECNKDINKDLCFCYWGSCEVNYDCYGTSTTYTNNILTNSTEGNCKDYEKRLCEISKKAKLKDWIWRYCR